MCSTRWLTVGLLLARATAQADLAPPDVRTIDPQMAFAGVQDHADHVFLIHVRDKAYWGPNVEFESRVIPIPGPEPFTPGFRKTIEKVAVLAVPKAAYDELSEDQRQALSAESPGVLSCGIDKPPTTVRGPGPETVTIRYRVAITDGKLRVEPVEPDDRDSSAAPPDRGRRAWWGIALAASVAWLGLVVGRRIVRGDS